MKRLRPIYFAMMILTALTALIVPAYPQEPKDQNPAKDQTKAQEEISIYGEVKAVSLESNSLNVQYYDYDSDEEKTIDIIVDKDTKIENAPAGIKDIKANDWVDVAYSVVAGKNTAKSISVEKEEEFTAETTAPAAPGAVGEEE